MTLFGALNYNGTDNIGDEIQSIAAMNRLPRVDFFLDRDNLYQDAKNINGEISIILNGWFLQFPEKWPPSENLRPLCISMHITREAVSSSLQLHPSAVLTAEPMANYLRRFGPIGARDKYTRDLLNAAGIESYFSGCLTMTLERPSVSKSKDLIILNDIPPEVIQHIRKNTKKFTFLTSHIGHNESDSTARFNLAQEYLTLYARASCVVTSRLHCALPCLAMGTPVLLIETAADHYRFDGLRDFLHHCSADDFISGKFDYNTDSPPDNKEDYLPYRQALLDKVKNFIAQTEDPIIPHPEFSYPTREACQEGLNRLGLFKLS